MRFPADQIAGSLTCFNMIGYGDWLMALCSIHTHSAILSGKLISGYTI